MKGSSLPNRECVRLRQVTTGRTHLTYRRVTQRQVHLKFKGLYRTDRNESSNTESYDYPTGIPLGDVLFDDVSHPREKDSSASARDYHPEMIDNPDMFRVTKSRRAMKKKREIMEEREWADRSADYENSGSGSKDIEEVKEADLIQNRENERERVDLKELNFSCRGKC